MRKFAAGCALLACAAPVRAQPSDLPAAPGKLVDVGGRRMHLLCSGAGSPTVVIEAGASSFAIDFTLVQRELEKTQRVCSYDRAGMGWSDPQGEGSRASTAADLHNLLRTAGEPGPYILVGASRGGLLIRDFQARYPADVQGMLFLDPATEDRLFWTIQGQTMRVADVSAEQLRNSLPAKSVAVPRRKPQTGSPFDRLPPDLYRVRVLLDERLIASYPDSVTPEVIGAGQESERALLSRLDSLRKASEHPLADLPTVGLSRGTDRNPEREASHAAVARLSRNSYHCVIEGAGHEIHLFTPEAVVHAINDIRAAIRDKGPLKRTAC